MMDCKIIGTHSGAFHADDVLACAMLKLHPLFKDARIERSRSQELLDEFDIVVDVGGSFSHEDKRYDHHQKGFDLTMKELSGGEINSDIKLSSAGLVYFYYGREIIQDHLGESDQRKTDWIWKMIYSNLIKEIDSIDNNGSKGSSNLIKTGFTTRIGRLNPDWDWDEQNPDSDKCFLSAVEVATEEFLDLVKDMESQYRAKGALTEQIMNRKDHHPSGRVLILRKCSSWKGILLRVEREVDIEGEILFIVKPKKLDEAFSVHAVYKRIFFPSEWRGLMDEELQRVTGANDAIFVHSYGHLAVVKSKETAIMLVDQLLDRYEAKRSENRENMKKFVSDWMRSYGATES